MKFSIILPVYNADEFLRAAVDSVLNQSFGDFELILIDDGSVDGSAVICDEYGRLDPRVRVFHRVNCGISKSRNFGLDQARGEYVGFCDHDDLYLPGFLEKASQLLFDGGGEKIDAIKFGRENVRRFRDGRLGSPLSGRLTGTFEWDWDMNYWDLAWYRTVVWNGFYRTEFIRQNGLRFDESIRCGSDDIQFNLQVLRKARRELVCTENYYRHFENEATSTSMSYHGEMIAEYDRIIKFELGSFKFNDRRCLARYGWWMNMLWFFLFSHKECPLSPWQKSGVVAHWARVMIPCSVKMFFRGGGNVLALGFGSRRFAEFSIAFGCIVSPMPLNGASLSVKTSLVKERGEYECAS